jgi:hypothetical protein
VVFLGVFCHSGVCGGGCLGRGGAGAALFAGPRRFVRALLRRVSRPRVAQSPAGGLSPPRPCAPAAGGGVGIDEQPDAHVWTTWPGDYIFVAAGSRSKPRAHGRWVAAALRRVRDVVDPLEPVSAVHVREGPTTRSSSLASTRSPGAGCLRRLKQRGNGVHLGSEDATTLYERDVRPCVGGGGNTLGALHDLLGARFRARVPPSCAAIGVRRSRCAAAPGRAERPATTDCCRPRARRGSWRWPLTPHRRPEHVIAGASGAHGPVRRCFSKARGRHVDQGG